MNNIMILSIVTNFQFIKLVVGCHVFGALIPPLMRKYDHRKPFFVPIITAFNFTMTLSLNVLIGGSSLHFENAPPTYFSINEFLINDIPAFFVLLIGIVSLPISDLKIRITRDTNEEL